MDQVPAGAIPVDEAHLDSAHVPEGAVPVDQVDVEGKIPEGAVPVGEADIDENQDLIPGQGHTSLLEMGKTALEGAARGASFGLSSGLETQLGVNPQDIIARQEANPTIAKASEILGTVGSAFIPGVGEGWLLAKGAKALIPIANELSTAAKVGRLALRGMMETAGYQAGDEVSNALLGKTEDSAAAVAGRIAKAGAVGLLVSAPLGAGGQALEKLQSGNIGHYLDEFAIGLGAAKEGNAEMVKGLYKAYGMPLSKGFDHGVKFFDETSTKIGQAAAAKASGIATSAVGNTIGGLPGAVIAYDIAKKYIDPWAEKLASKATPSITRKVVVPVMLKAIEVGNSDGIVNALNHGAQAANGARLIEDAIEDVFNDKSANEIDQELLKRDREKLNEYLENGGINQEIMDLQQSPYGYAKGGEVKPAPSNGVSNLYPDQNIMINTTKGNISNYLNSLRPQKSAKMTFDNPYDDKQAKAKYERALDIANKPLSVLKHIKDGTVLPEYVKHMAAMYPELYQQLSKKMTQKIIKQQLEDKKPNHKTIQGLSLFLGASLTTDMTPEGIQAAQQTFARTKLQPPQQKGSKTDPKKLDKISDMAETPSQSRDDKRSKK